MSYSISYSPETAKQYPAVPKKRTLSEKGRKGIVYIAIAALLISLWQIPNVRRLFLPGDPTQTEAALDVLSNSLREGDSLEDAFTAFCDEVLRQAGRG